LLFERFKTLAESLPTTNGIRLSGALYPYATLAERAERIAAGLIDHGVQHGDPVGILSNTTPDVFALTYALFAIGAIAVPLDLGASPQELEMNARRAKVRLVIARADLAPAAQALSDALGLKLPMITIGGGSPSLADLERTSPRTLAVPGPDTVSHYMNSSGSTGRPKVVPHTHAEVLADVAISQGVFGYRTDDVLLNMMPLNHAFGFVMAICHSPLSGVSMLMWADPQPLPIAKGRLLGTIVSEGVTILPGVPFLYDLLTSVPEGGDLSKVRTAFCGAVPLKRPTYDNFLARFGVPIRQAYGSTETLVTTYNNHPDPSRTWDSVGQVPEEVRIEMLPVEGNPDPTVGEMVIYSDVVTKGYLDNPEANAESFKDGGWISGDLGRFDDEGNCYILGRKKLILQVAGQKVDPIEIEDILISHPGIAEAVVVGVPDPRGGEQRLKAVVVTKGDGDTADNIVRFARDRLQAHKVPYLVEFRDTLPRSSTGKILRGKLVD